jgi:mRNA interferase MazF
VKQGDIWWVDLPDEKSRPYLVLTRERAIPVLHSVLVAPITTRVRGLAAELPVSRLEGMSTDSVANFDNVKTIRKTYLTRRLGELGAGRWPEVCAAMRAAIDC